MRNFRTTFIPNSHAMQPCVFRVLAIALAGIATFCHGLPSSFIRGASGLEGNAQSGALLKELGSTHARAYVMWKYIQPKLDSYNASLTVDYVREHPQLIDEWSTSPGVDFKQVDQRVKVITSNGVEPIVEIGEGSVYGLPQYNGKLANPAVLGRDAYLAYMYLYGRAVVKRYKSICSFYQIENELNEAYLAVLGEQRVADPAWSDWTFLTDILRTLRMAVKDEQPDARVTTNLHTDVPQYVHEILHLPGFYVDAAANWSSLVDIWSIDAYPNMYVPSPIRADEIGRRISNVRAAAPGLHVFVMETGYPVANTTTGAPSIFNYSEASQAAYAVDTVKEVVAAGGVGLLYFDLTPCTGLMPPPGGYEPDDVTAATLLEQVLLTGNYTDAVLWALGHTSYLLSRFPQVVSRSKGWGLLYSDGSPRPAFDALRAEFRK